MHTDGPPTGASKPLAPPGGEPVPCPTCGALNGRDFSSCVRCARALGDDLTGPAPTPRPSEPPAPAARPRPTQLAGQFRFRPRDLPATTLLLGLMAAVFALQLAFAFARDPSAAALLTGGTSTDLIRFGALPLGSRPLLLAEPWRMLSAVFVHVGIIHLGMNGAALVYLGRMLEPAIGPVRLVVLFVSTGLAGFALSAMAALQLETHAVTAGASGSLFGMMGAVLGMLLIRRDRRWRLWLTQAVLFSLAFGFAVGIANNAAHMGGLALGVVLGLGMGRHERRPAARWERGAAALSLVACLLSLGLAQRSELWQLLEKVSAEESSAD